MLDTAVALLVALAGGAPPPGTPPAEAVHLTLRGGANVPTGPSLDGFGTGGALEGGIAWQFMDGASLQLDGGRYTTAANVGLRLRAVGAWGSLSLVVHRALTPAVEVYGFGGLGWFRHDLEVTDGRQSLTSGQGRLGFQLGGGLAIPVAGRLAVQAEFRYGGAYATLFENPAWIGSFRMLGGLRYTFPV